MAGGEGSVSDKGLKSIKDPREKLLLSMRVTSNCRYRAAIRLNMKSEASFFATTFLSLGLILIPLVQSSGVTVCFDEKVAGAMQVFMAVCVLVYSVVISKAGYEVRSEKLNRCGDDLKELARELERSGDADGKGLEYYSRQYSIISSTCENHEDLDYLISRLHMSRDYHIDGVKRVWLIVKSWLMLRFMYFLPALYVGIGFFFFTDFIGVTKFYPEVFKVNICMCSTGS
ncbi:SLATT domain-containing protein [Pseudomonas sp. A-1]|uniref:SLATT domain-containing protein n=1 Tax=Pseudomonas sp. A-1 TaxID=1821274 RepID=UPI0010A5E806|nr:SLATT domain-containing protein [Pseudomonas sp. A-1]THG87121.1 SLATT domain-containing protein [Pseudomonas sp. A-1]